MGSPRFLTKSRFKSAYTCARKLYYLDRPEYGNNLKENDFLEALAQGGYQVGALAKVQYSGGIDLEDLGSEAAIQKTNELLKQEEVTIYEAALNVGPYLVRVDILQKIGNILRLIEVKAKGYGADDESFMRKDGKGILSTWEPYLVDVAFQTWVAQKLFPNAQVKAYLLLANKDAVATVDSLHQQFRILNVNGRSHVEINPGTTRQSIGAPLLKEVDVAHETDFILNEMKFPGGLTLPEYAEKLSGYLNSDALPEMEIGAQCKSCEFRANHELKAAGKKSGFEECWKVKDENLIFDIWNFRGAEELIEENRIRIDQLEKEDFEGKNGLTPTGERQWIQVEKIQKKDPTPFIDHAGLKKLFATFQYPLHFIDFETSMVAIPFHKDRRPYEQIAFQFSHHTLDSSGAVKHADEYIHFTPGEFPNFEFVRALKKSLSGDQGTIFRYADHENTVLRQIRTQILSLPENEKLPDEAELVEFIESITKPKNSEGGKPGERCMIDLKKIIMDHFYHPLMGGSNSIKKVIPAIHPGENPYKKLKPVFSDIPQETFESESPLFTEDSIDDGGAAMTAWARMQFTEMKPIEREAIKNALLRYCELDTLSMVWILQYLQREVTNVLG